MPINWFLGHKPQHPLRVILYTYTFFFFSYQQIKLLGSILIIQVTSNGVFASISLMGRPTNFRRKYRPNLQLKKYQYKSRVFRPRKIQI